MLFHLGSIQFPANKTYAVRIPILVTHSALSRHNQTMREISRFLYDLVVCMITLLRPCGVESVAAENLILRQQLIVIGRTRKRFHRLTQTDRTIFEFCQPNLLGPQESAT